jgi:hypothetical protein
MASIEKRTTANGKPRWEVRYRVAGREVSRTFTTRAKAIAHRRQVEHDEMRGVGYDPRAGKATLDEWWAQWWPSTVNLRASSRARDASYYRARIKPTLGDVESREVGRRDVARMGRRTPSRWTRASDGHEGRAGALQVSARRGR